MGLFTANISPKSVIEAFSALKKNVSEWVVALDTRQYELQKRVEILEARQRDIEAYLRSRKWN